jgi:hypothetical protein
MDMGTKRLAGAILFSVGSIAGNAGMIWSYFSQPPMYIPTLLIQAIISVCFAWLLVKRPGRAAKIGTIIGAVTAFLIVIFSYAGLYRHFGLVNAGGATTQDAFDCLYFSLVTFTTLGYGDFLPIADARFIAASEALVGYVLMAALIAIFARLFRGLFGVDAAQITHA